MAGDVMITLKQSPKRHWSCLHIQSTKASNLYAPPPMLLLTTASASHHRTSPDKRPEKSQSNYAADNLVQAMFGIIITIYQQLKKTRRQRRPEMEASNYMVTATRLLRALLNSSGALAHT